MIDLMECTFQLPAKLILAGTLSCKSMNQANGMRSRDCQQHHAIAAITNTGKLS